MHDFKYLSRHNAPLERERDSLRDTLTAIITLYAMGITLFLFGLRQAGIL